MSYLDRLKQGEFSQKCPPKVLTKATKPPFDGFDSCPSEHIPEKTASNEERRYWWWIWLDGKRVGKVAGGLMSRAEALKSCSATWPERVVEVTADEYTYPRRKGSAGGTFK